MSAMEATPDVEEAVPWDAVIIGAGPSGAMAARELAIGGARVLLVERRDFPREKVCGGCLNGQALAVLRSAGLAGLAERSGGLPLSSFRVGVRGRSARLDLPAGLVVARARFDAELVDAAVAAGAQFLPRTEARVGPLFEATRAVQLGVGREVRTVHGRVVLLATGLGDPRLPAGSAPRTRPARGAMLGAGCLLDCAPDDYEPGTIHMAIGPSGYVGLVRLAGGHLHVAGAIPPRLLEESGGPGAASASILAAAGFPPIPGLRAARWRGTVGLTRRTRPLADERLFVLGDAAGYVEPFTGEGIAWALASGRALAPLALSAIGRWEPGLAREWDALHGRVVRRRQATCRAASAVLRRPWLVRVAFEVVARLPGAAGRLVDLLNAPPPLPEARPSCPP